MEDEDGDDDGDDTLAVAQDLQRQRAGVPCDQEVGQVDLLLCTGDRNVRVATRNGWHVVAGAAGGTTLPRACPSAVNTHT